MDIKVILASASPRRLELLRQVGIEPVVEPSNVEEVITSMEPDKAVMELSAQKAKDIAALHAGEEAVVIGADTVVAADGEILGKPSNREDAVRMLTLLQGRAHQVYTGVTLVFCGGKPRTVTFAERTDVFVCPMSRAQIEAYVDTGEPMDKAGAYGVQSLGALLVERIDGDFYNVMGLPVEKLGQCLTKHFGVRFF